MRLKLIILILLLSNQLINAQIKDTISITTIDVQSYTLPTGETYTYKKPKFFDMLTKIPRGVIGTAKDFGKTENLIALGGATLLTIALVQKDQQLLESAQERGRKWHMADVARYDTFGPFNIPPNMTSGIYLIGNGSTPILLSMGFATYGLINKDYRSLNTATGLIESLAVSGVFSQTVKRITGRQSPAPAIQSGNDGGAWNPFPSFPAYSARTPQYDAMPSGHLMTATSALYVIMGNYPEVRWIKPIGYTLIGVLGFQMVQSSVHWTSDYPLALVMGYIIGKNIANSKIEKSGAQKEEPKKYTFNISASRESGFNLIGANITF